MVPEVAAQIEDQMMMKENDGSGAQEQLKCSKGFFFDENVTNLCRPACGEFRQTKIEIQALENATICICFIASVAMFILALTVQRNTL